MNRLFGLLLLTLLWAYLPASPHSAADDAPLGKAVPLPRASNRNNPAPPRTPSVTPASHSQQAGQPATVPPGLPMPGVVQTIDLASALKLADIDNPTILLARERVVEAAARRQLAAAQLLPSLNAGLNYDAHIGPLQQSNSKILTVNRDSLYVGAGAFAVASGSVNIPGVVLQANVAQTLFQNLFARQEVARRRFVERATANEMLRRVAGAYLELLRTEGLRSLTLQATTEAEKVSRLAKDLAETKQGRWADYERAASELANRRIDQVETDAKVNIASARLAALLNLPPLPRLHPAEERYVPLPVVPELIPLPELLAIALLQRPELAERRVAIRQALLELRGAKALPFSPDAIVGYSAGTFGGGSNLVTTQPRFGSFAGRDDFEVVLYWTVRNLGVTNVALVRLADSHARSAKLEEVQVLNRVRSEVAQASARCQAYYARMLASEKAITAGQSAFSLDMNRVKGLLGLPIELLDSFRLLNQSRLDYLDAIAGYNQAQLDLYVALGQPPADVLARRVPLNFSPEVLKSQP